MFKTIEDIPTPIAEFYTTETRREQAFNFDGTPTMHEVEYTYTDENGDQKTATRMEPVYIDVHHVVPLPIPEFKTWKDVWRVAKLHRGQRDDLIRRFITMVCNETQWNFLDEYLAWYKDKLPIEERKPVQARDENGAYIPDDASTEFNEAWVDGFSYEVKAAMLAAIAENEPPKPDKIDVDQWFLDNALHLRQYAYPTDAERTSMYCDDMINGTTTLVDRIMAVNKQYPTE